MSDVNSTTMVINPVNSRAFYNTGETIIFDYTSSLRGFIDPKSIYLSYKATATNAAGPNNYGHMLGCPAYSPFLKLETIINSQSIETVNQWNQICNFYINTNMGVSDKAGMQSAFGYNESLNDDGTLIPYDARRLTSAAVVPTTQSYFISCPLICNILTGCSKLIPSFLMPQIRQQFTI